VSKSLGSPNCVFSVVNFSLASDVSSISNHMQFIQLGVTKRFFNLGRDTTGAVNHFLRSREEICYVNSCITFALFEF